MLELHSLVAIFALALTTEPVKRVSIKILGDDPLAILGMFKFLQKSFNGDIRITTGIRASDFAHKLSDSLTKENQLIVFEDLQIGNMVKNHSLASAIMDACWGKTRQLTAYKAERRGGRVMLVPPSGTSQKCSGCGETVPKDLSVRVHECPNCGLVLDRDVNAARNILQAGQELARVEAVPLLVQRRRISKFGR